VRYPESGGDEDAAELDGPDSAVAGLAVMTRMMSVAAAPGGVPVTRLESGTSLEL
jgi:hypothetical protein